MKVNMSLSLKVLSFDGFGSKSLVYNEVFEQLSKVIDSEGLVLGDRLVLPGHDITFNFDLSK